VESNFPSRSCCNLITSPVFSFRSASGRVLGSTERSEFRSTVPFSMLDQNFPIMQPFQRAKSQIPLSGRAGTAWEPSKPEPQKKVSFPSPLNVVSLATSPTFSLLSLSLSLSLSLTLLLLISFYIPSFIDLLN
jgi:hypothetical protein